MRCFVVKIRKVDKDKVKRYIIGNVTVEIVDETRISVNDNISSIEKLEADILNYIRNE